MNEEKRVGEILYLEGKTNLVVFAPHARKNDDNNQYEEKTENIAKALRDNDTGSVNQTPKVCPILSGN